MGQSALFDGGIVENREKRGGNVSWNFTTEDTGIYRLAFKYSTPTVRGIEIRLDGDSIGRIYFLKKTDAYQTIDLKIAEPGLHELRLTATGTTGLPDISALRIFPLDGQAVPLPADMTGIISLPNSDDGEIVDVYSLSGVFIRSSPQSQLRFPLGERSSAVVVLQNSVGGTPYIVRKHRLK